MVLNLDRGMVGRKNFYFFLKKEKRKRKEMKIVDWVDFGPCCYRAVGRHRTTASKLNWTILDSLPASWRPLCLCFMLQLSASLCLSVSQR